MTRTALKARAVGIREADEPKPSNARLAADLQALTLALHIGGLEGLRTGQIRMATTKRDSGSPQ